MSETSVIELPNGIRLVHRQIKSTQMVHAGLLIRAGSRDETPENNGIAHLIEHAVFKGTGKRKAFQLFNLIESVGGEVNAYTTREITAFYTSSLKRYADRSLDLLSDMCFNPKYDETELAREKSVVHEEIEMYQDSPDDSIYDDFFLKYYGDHPLGYNILGTRDSLNGIGAEDLRNFQKLQYARGRVILSICGNISLAKAEKLALRYFSDIKLNAHQDLRKAPAQPGAFHLELDKDFNQSHCILGGEAMSRHDERRFAMMVLNNYLGGHNMSSRLNLSVREKHGYTYNIGSSYTAFDDSGLFFVSFGCEEKNLKPALNLVNKELKLLREKKLGPVQLAKAKRQLQGQLAMMAENPSILMQSNAKSLFHYESVIPLTRIFELIDLVSAESIRDIANELLTEDRLSSIIYQSNKE